VTGALWYLFRTTAWNRLRRQATRLRNPRYAVAFALGALYFWFFLFRPSRGERPPIDLTQSPLVTVGAPAFFLLAIAYAWIFGADKSALAFTPAEVALLFPAPVSRRALILFKLARSQAAILFTIVIWMLLLRRGTAALPSPLFAAGLWAVLSTYALHRLGVALLRSGVAEHGAGGARRSVPAMLVFAAVVAAVAAGFWNVRAELLAAPGPEGLLRTVTETLHAPPAGIALAPLNLLLAPLSAPDASAWLRAIGPALLILGLHVWWVMRSDAAFEEAAAEASVKQAKRIAEFKARRSGAAVPKAKGARRTLALAPTGAPAVAILWKNAIWLQRTGQVRSILLPPAIALGALLVFGRKGDEASQVIAAMTGVVTLMFLMLGPMILRNDLRADLLQLQLLKTLPLRARDVVLVQVLGTSGAMWVGQVLMVLIGGAALSTTALAAKIPGGVLAAALIGTPALLLALNAANFTIHNGAAVLFPGWVRLGETPSGGVEAMGQMMMIGLATILALVLLLVAPAIVGTIVVAFLRGAPAAAVAAGALTAAAVLAGEVYLLILGLARAYDRVEPLQTV
jgi:hypothetical protein